MLFLVDESASSFIFSSLIFFLCSGSLFFLIFYYNVKYHIFPFFNIFIIIFGANVPYYDTYGLFRATHSHVYAPLRSVLNMCHWHIAPTNIRISRDYHPTFMLILGPGHKVIHPPMSKLMWLQTFCPWYLICFHSQNFLSFFCHVLCISTPDGTEVPQPDILYA